MLREGELLQDRPTDVAVALVVAAALLGAEHDLRAILAVGVFLATIGICRLSSGTAVLLCPELEVLFGTENLRARTAESVRHPGTYFVKSLRGGRTYRIAVQK